MSAQPELTEAVSSFYANPLGFVLFAFPWLRSVRLQLPWAGAKNDMIASPDPVASATIAVGGV